jgi:hypothetical protein
MNVNRRAADLERFPDLVVIYLGMRANRPRGLLTILQLAPQIEKSVKEQPDGLLLHERLTFSLVPPHIGMRQYWRDFDAMERWARSLPHQHWWRRFAGDSRGTGFWHETYFMGGGMEAIYDDMKVPVGLMNVAPLQPARGAMFSARARAGLPGRAAVAAPFAEEELHHSG